MAEEEKKKEMLKDLKTAQLMYWDRQYGNRTYFLQKENGDEVYLRDIIADFTFLLVGKIKNQINEKDTYEESREEKDIISTLNALINAYKTGLF